MVKYKASSVFRRISRICRYAVQHFIQYMDPVLLLVLASKPNLKNKTN